MPIHRWIMWSHESLMPMKPWFWIKWAVHHLYSIEGDFEWVSTWVFGDDMWCNRYFMKIFLIKHMIWWIISKLWIISGDTQNMIQCGCSADLPMDIYVCIYIYIHIVSVHFTRIRYQNVQPATNDILTGNFKYL